MVLLRCSSTGLDIKIIQFKWFIGAIYCMCQLVEGILKKNLNKIVKPINLPQFSSVLQPSFSPSTHWSNWDSSTTISSFAHGSSRNNCGLFMNLCGYIIPTRNPQSCQSGYCCSGSHSRLYLWVPKIGPYSTPPRPLSAERQHPNHWFCSSITSGSAILYSTRSMVSVE